MMNTLNSSPAPSKNSFKGSEFIAQPTTQKIDDASSKRFASVMTQAQLNARQLAAKKPALPADSAPAATSPNAKAKPAENIAQTGPGSEAHRAEASARQNAKTAARLLADRAAVKVPTVQVLPLPAARIEPHREASDSASAESEQAADETNVNGQALNPAATPTAQPRQTEAEDTSAVASIEFPPAATSAAKSAATSEATSEAKSAAGPELTQRAGLALADRKTPEVLEEDAAAQAAGRLVTDANRTKSRPDKLVKSVLDEAPSNSPPQTKAVTTWSTAMPLERQTNHQTPNLAASAQTTADSNAMPGKGAVQTGSETKPSAFEFSSLLASGLNAASLNAYAASTVQNSGVLTLSLSTPANAPEFREALGLQVSLLARDGVQTAELHLNPADMGPVSIQIVMEGNQARVEFGADVAATRKAIEEGMPELASALRDAGFTLAGGGVSQHAKGKDQNNTDPRQSSGGSKLPASAISPDLALAAALLRRAPTTLGGVDVFA